MATKLDKPVTRELRMVHKTRAVNVTLVPGNDEAIEFHLKGTQQRVRVGLPAVLQFAIRSAMTGRK